MSAHNGEINLLPQQVVEERRVSRFLHWSLTYGRYIIIGTEFVVLMAFFSRFRLDQELSDLHESINQKQLVIANIADKEREMQRLGDRLKVIRDLDKNQMQYLDMLTFLEDVLPKNVVISKLDFTGKNVHLTAITSTYSGFSQTIRTLRNSQKVQHVVVEGLDKSASGKLRLNFQMSFDIVPKF